MLGNAAESKKNLAMLIFNCISKFIVKASNSFGKELVFSITGDLILHIVLSIAQLVEHWASIPKVVDPDSGRLRPSSVIEYYACSAWTKTQSTTRQTLFSTKHITPRHNNIMIVRVDVQGCISIVMLGI